MIAQMSLDAIHPRFDVKASSSLQLLRDPGLPQPKPANRSQRLLLAKLPPQKNDEARAADPLSNSEQAAVAAESEIRRDELDAKSSTPSEQTRISVRGATPLIAVLTTTTSAEKRDGKIDVIDVSTPVVQSSYVRQGENNVNDNQSRNGSIHQDEGGLSILARDLISTRGSEERGANSLPQNLTNQRRSIGSSKGSDSSFLHVETNDSLLDDEPWRRNESSSSDGPIFSGGVNSRASGSGAVRNHFSSSGHFEPDPSKPRSRPQSRNAAQRAQARSIRWAPDDQLVIETRAKTQYKYSESSNNWKKKRSGFFACLFRDRSDDY